MSQSLLFEIGAEELPARFLSSLSETLASNIEKKLRDASLSYHAIHHYATPRRIAIFVENIATEQPAHTVEKRGPALQVAFDVSGNPTAATLGFAKSCGVEVAALEKIENEKGAWLCFRQQQTGKSAEMIIPNIISESIRQLPLNKPMRWGESSIEFLRPVHWVLLMLGAKTIPMKIWGLETSSKTFGHRFHHPQAVSLTHVDEYVNQLLQANVIVSIEQRKKMIEQQMMVLTAPHQWQVVMLPELLEEVTGLVEWPVALLGNFKAEFLALPREVLLTSMQQHQKSFAILDAQGKLLPHFITISNLRSRSPEAVIQGNERVMRARLSDAAFFYHVDQQTSLHSRVEALKNVTFQANLGSLYDKTQRIIALASFLAQKINLSLAETERAAMLCKADLTSQMVGEFPELQGVMGYYYALHDNESEVVALAIQQHYQPRFAGDTIPASLLSCIIAVADKMDTLAGIFGINKIPTGDKDPYALRRAANGILHIMLTHALPITLKELITQSVATYSTNLSNKNVADELYSFFIERLKIIYQERGFSTLMIHAVIAREIGTPTDGLMRLSAVKDFMQHVAAEALVAANKRVSNILAKQKVVSGAFNAALLEHPAEQALAKLLVQKRQDVDALLKKAAYTQILMSLAELKDPIDTFFEQVMVMVEDSALRLNRLILLQQLRELFLPVADVSLMG